MPTFTSTFPQRLTAAIRAKGTPVCIGLDPNHRSAGSPAGRYRTGWHRRR